jgi:hypothetical protein
MVARTENFSHLIAPGLKKVFFQQYDQWPEEYQKFLNVESTNRAYEEDSEVSGLGIMGTKGQGEPVTYEDPFQASALVRYTPVRYALGYRVTYEMYKNDLYGIHGPRMSKALARSARQAVEVAGANILNRAFNTGYPGRDSAALCSRGHLNIAKDVGSGGATTGWVNTPATQADISIATLTAALQRIEELVDEKGLNIALHPKKLIYFPPNRALVSQLLGSTLEPFTGDNQKNAIKDWNLESFCSHFGSDTDAWFVQCAAEEHRMMMYWREKIAFKNGDDFDTGDGKFAAFQWFVCGFSGWRGIDGSSGG